MNLLLGAWTVGLILSLLALGVYVSFRIFHFPDITADGSITLGASVAAILIVRGWDPFLASALACLAGVLAGTTTGVLHAKFGVHKLLSGILVMTALYSINLHILGKSNVPLLEAKTVTSVAERAASRLSGGAETFKVASWTVNVDDAAALAFALLAAVLVASVMYAFFCTNLGTAMRATGDNDQMIRALGVSVENMTILGLAISNGLVALAGALLTQYQGFADAQMGIGMVVWGLASVIIGQALVGEQHLGLTLAGTIMGSVLFRLLVAIALRWGLNPNDLKLVTALFVLGALVLPGLLARMRRKAAQLRHA